MKVACAVSSESDMFLLEFPGMLVLDKIDSVPLDLDLLILTGGVDINPKLYGESAQGSWGWDDKRDSREIDILSTVVRTTSAKVLGVCRGFQLLNITFGGTLFQDINHPYTHSLEFDVKESPLSWLTRVNSLHHQGIKTLGGSGKLIHAIEPKTGIPEIVSWKNRFLGVQFHPELFNTDLRQRFFGAIKNWVSGGCAFGSDQNKYDIRSIFGTATGTFTLNTGHVVNLPEDVMNIDEDNGVEEEEIE